MAKSHNKEYIPIPLFDNLEHIDTPMHESSIDLRQYFSGNTLPSDAATDYRHICNFLYTYRGSSETFKTYRRETERLLQWAWFMHKKSIKTLSRLDFEAFLEFCQKPPKYWIGLKHVPRFLTQHGERVKNSEWRPFVASISKKAHRDGQMADVKSYSLSQSALQSIFSILSSFYNYLIQEEYVSINPIAQIRQKSKFLRKQQTKRQIRRLSEMQWDSVIETAEKMAQDNPELHERTLFIMNALYAMYLRVSELASNDRWTAEMGDFFKDMDGNWWFKTVGKGNKERDISVSDSMLDALRRYRQSLALSPLPSPGETTPLIPKAVGNGPIKGTRHIRKIVQACFDKAIERLRKDKQNEEADMLMSATVHWLRHTGISEDVKTRPREHVRDDAGHSSSAITDRYIDIELRERHASAKQKLIKKD